MNTPSIYLKLAERSHKQADERPMRPDTKVKSVAFFRANLDSKDCYVFFDGRVMDGEVYRDACSVKYNKREDTITGAGYHHSVIRISIDGIPLNVSRSCFEIAAELGEPNWLDAVKARYISGLTQ